MAALPHYATEEFLFLNFAIVTKLNIDELVNMSSTQVGLLLLVCLGSAAACHAPAARSLHSDARQTLQEAAQPGHETLALALDVPAGLLHDGSGLPGGKPSRGVAVAGPLAPQHEDAAGSEPRKAALTATTRLHRPPLREGRIPAQRSAHSGRSTARPPRLQRGKGPAAAGRRLLQAWDDAWQQPPGGLDVAAVGLPFEGLQEGPLPLPGMDPPALALGGLPGGDGPPLLQTAASIGAGWGPPRLGALFSRPPLLWVAGAAPGPLPAAPGPLPAAPNLAPAPQPAAATPSGGVEAAAPIGAGGRLPSYHWVVRMPCARGHALRA